MAIQIVPHSREFSQAVQAFNLRMRQGGSQWGFYTEPVPDWLAKQPGQRVWREYHLAIEDGTLVRGGYGLKPQEWLIHGKVQIVADWQGPFSEGAYDPKWNTLGLRMVRDMLKKHPLLYSWGHGGNDQPIVLMLKKMGWLLHETPFCLRIVQPRRFLLLNEYLRKTPQRKLALDALAYSGAGSIGLRLLHLSLRLRAGKRFDATASVVDSFGPWADALWERCKDRYAAIAVRDAACMNALLPPNAWPPVTRLKVEAKGQVVGWAAVMETAMQHDHRFGNMRVGSIVDCLAAPEDAGQVVAAATAFLKTRDVDIVVSNQAHPQWAQGFGDNGYIVLQDRRLFAASPPLQQALEPFAKTALGLHLTNLDGHGPMAL